jgi:hypothetical protein
MRRGLLYAASAALLLTAAGTAQAQTPAGQPTSEGHPHKWQTSDKSMYDLVADGYRLITAVYDSAGTGPTSTPDVHYFLEKGNSLAKCEFRKRGDTSFYWCYLLAKAGAQ